MEVKAPGTAKRYRLHVRMACASLLLAGLFAVPESFGFTHELAPTQRAGGTRLTESGCCGPITPAGEQLLQVLAGMDVDHLWRSQTKIEWRTGLPREGHGHTHCSAFAAAAGDRLGIYLLRPPQHGQDFLASAQGRWFASEQGQRDGWRALRTIDESQRFANRGDLVVLVYINPDEHVPGHIAIVRPAVKSAEALEREGPQTMQAGMSNFSNGTAVQSFKHHPGAWPSQVHAYAHTTRFEERFAAAPDAGIQ